MSNRNELSSGLKLQTCDTVFGDVIWWQDNFRVKLNSNCCWKMKLLEQGEPMYKTTTENCILYLPVLLLIEATGQQTKKWMDTFKFICGFYLIYTVQTSLKNLILTQLIHPKKLSSCWFDAELINSEVAIISMCKSVLKDYTRFLFFPSMFRWAPAKYSKLEMWTSTNTWFFYKNISLSLQLRLLSTSGLLKICA